MYDDIGSVLKIKQLQTEKENFCSLWKCIIRYFSLVETIEDDGEMMEVRKADLWKHYENEVENWFCRDRESLYSGTNGWSYGSSIPYSLQGAGAGLLCTEMVGAKAISFS